MPKHKKPAIPVHAAEKMLQADAANLVRKVAKGHSLTSEERAYLMEVASDEEDSAKHQATAKNMVELAAILGVSRQTVYLWKKRKEAPRASSNGTHNVDEWRKFCRRFGRKHNDQRADGEGLEALKAKRLMVEIAERQHRLAKRAEGYIDAVLVAKQWAFHVDQAITLLRNMLEKEVAKLKAEKDPAVIRMEMSLVIDNFCKTLHEGG